LWRKRGDEKKVPAVWNFFLMCAFPDYGGAVRAPRTTAAWLCHIEEELNVH
jgi:hypothetical protein